jgi:hypothetical protein
VLAHTCNPSRKGGQEYLKVKTKLRYIAISHLKKGGGRREEGREERRKEGRKEGS